MVVEHVPNRTIQEDCTQNKAGKKTKRQAQTRVVRARAKGFKQGAIGKTEENPALVLSHNTARDAILLRKAPENSTRCRTRCKKFQRRFILKTKKKKGINFEPLAHKTIRRPWRMKGCKLTTNNQTIGGYR